MRMAANITGKEEKMLFFSSRVRTLALALVLIAPTVAAPATAETAADFYKGKTVNVLIGVGAGGEYDLQARLVARFLGKHIPGNPIVVPQNMTAQAASKWRITSTRLRRKTAPLSE